MAVINSLQNPRSNLSQARAGSGFTNLRRVLDANRQNRLGQVVGSGVREVGEEAKGGIQRGQSEFQQGLGKEQTRLTDVGTQVKGVLAGDLTNVNDQTANTFENVRAGQFLGPNAIKNQEAIQSKAREAENLGKFVGGTQNKEGILQRFVGSPRYSLGQQSLDNLILQQTGRPQLQQARQSTSGLGRLAERQGTAAEEQSKGVQSQARVLGQETVGQLGGLVTDYDKAMIAKAEQANIGKEALIARAKAQLGTVGDTGALDADVAKSLGLDANFEIMSSRVNPFYGKTGEGPNYMGYDVSRNMGDYFKYDPTQAQKQTIQSDQDFNRIQALKRLAGQDVGKEASDYYDKGLVGSFAKTPIASMDTAAYEDDKRRFNEYIKGGVFQNQLAGFKRSADRTEDVLFGNKATRNYNEKISDLLKRQAADLNASGESGTTQAQALAAQAAGDKTVGDYLSRIRNTTGLSEDFDLAGDPRDKANAASILGDALQNDFISNINNLADRNAVVRQLQDFATLKKLKLNNSGETI